MQDSVGERQAPYPVARKLWDTPSNGNEGAHSLGIMYSRGMRSLLPCLRSTPNSPDGIVRRFNHDEPVYKKCHPMRQRHWETQKHPNHVRSLSRGNKPVVAFCATQICKVSHTQNTATASRILLVGDRQAAFIGVVLARQKYAGEPDICGGLPVSKRFKGVHSTVPTGGNLQY